LPVSEKGAETPRPLLKNRDYQVSSYSDLFVLSLQPYAIMIFYQRKFWRCFPWTLSIVRGHKKWKLTVGLELPGNPIDGDKICSLQCNPYDSGETEWSFNEVAKGALRGSTLAALSYLGTPDRFVHLFYQDENGGINEQVQNAKGEWSAGALPSRHLSLGVPFHVQGYNQHICQLRLYFVHGYGTSEADHVWEWSYDNGWAAEPVNLSERIEDLPVKASGPCARSGTAMAGFLDSNSDTVRLFFFAPDGVLKRMYFRRGRGKVVRVMSFIHSRHIL
jgi:hypothetical protein